MQNTQIKVYEKNKDSIVLLTPVVAIVAKIIEHTFLPDKYYYDNFRIVSMVNDSGYARKWPGSYEVAADFFRSINIFDFTSLFQWSMLLGIIFTVVMAVMFSKCKGMDMKQSLFAMMYVGLLNIYIFNIGKDSIQFLIFIALFIVLSLNISLVLRTIACFGILYWESTFYRNYYIIIAFFFIAVFLGINLLRIIKRKMSFIKVILIIIFLYLIVFAFLSVARVSMPEDYKEVMNCKVNTTQLLANSTIDDKIDHGQNLILYMENYIINSVRMAFPVELVRSGVFYLPFFAFQVFLIIYLGKAFLRLYRMDTKQVLALSIFVAYFMGSVLFEPDFGSFVRHEAATFPVAFAVFFSSDNWN